MAAALPGRCNRAIRSHPSNKATNLSQTLLTAPTKRDIFVSIPGDKYVTFRPSRRSFSCCTLKNNPAPSVCPSNALSSGRWSAPSAWPRPARRPCCSTTPAGSNRWISPPTPTSPAICQCSRPARAERYPRLHPPALAVVGALRGVRLHRVPRFLDMADDRGDFPFRLFHLFRDVRAVF